MGDRDRDGVIVDVRMYLECARVPGYSQHWVVYQPSGSTLVTASRFLARNREAELKPTTFPPLLLFTVFLSFLFPTYIAPWVFPAAVTL